MEAAAAELAPAKRPLGGSRGASSSSLSAPDEVPPRNGHDPNPGSLSADDAGWPSLGPGGAAAQGEPLGGLPGQAKERGGSPQDRGRRDGRAERAWPGLDHSAVSSQQRACGNDAWPRLEAPGQAAQSPSNGNAHGSGAIEGAADAAWRDQPERDAAGAGPHGLGCHPGSNRSAEDLSEAAGRSAPGSQAAADADDDEGLGDSADLFDEAAGPESQWSAPAPARPADPLAPWGGYGAGAKRGAKVKGKGACAHKGGNAWVSSLVWMLELMLSSSTKETIPRSCLECALAPPPVMRSHARQVSPDSSIELHMDAQCPPCCQCGAAALDCLGE